MWMCEDNIVEVPFYKEHLFEQILSPANLNRAYKAVMRNKGCGGIDKMSCEQLLTWLLTNKDELISSLMDGSYRPNPVKRVEIPKDNGKMRLLGIPTVVELNIYDISVALVVLKFEKSSDFKLEQPSNILPIFLIDEVFRYEMFSMVVRFSQPQNHA